MAERCLHFRLKDFVAPGESYHFARTDISDRNMARIHDHDYHEVFWATRGRGRHLWNGKADEVQTGSLYLIRPQDRHQVTGAGDAPLRLLNLAFPSTAWSAVRRRYFPNELDIFETEQPRRVRRLGTRDMARLEYWAERLVQSGRPMVARDGFLMELGFMGEGAPTVGHGELPYWLGRACREIARPERLVGGTQAFARLAGRSPAHVARASVRHLGRTPTEIVNEVRMEFAARRLEGSDDGIVDIVLACGLSNVSHFYALFRARYGTSPLQYRKQAHQTVRG